MKRPANQIKVGDLINWTDWRRVEEIFHLAINVNGEIHMQVAGGKVIHYHQDELVEFIKCTTVVVTRVYEDNQVTVDTDDKGEWTL